MKQVNLVETGGAFVRAPEPARDNNIAARAELSQSEASGKTSPVAGEPDLAKVLAVAREHRAQYVGRVVASFASALKRGLRRALQSDFERYLAGATDLADVERRLRTFERGEMPHAR